MSKYTVQNQTQKTPGKQSPSTNWLLLLGLLLLGFGLRIYQLDGQSLWWDEGISLHLATSTLPDLLRDRLDNIHPPLYFILLKGWITAVSPTPFTARYLSLLAAWLQIPLFVWCARQFGLPRRAQWLGAMLVIVSPLSVIYGQETRVYAFLPLVTLALLGLGRQIGRGKRQGVRRMLPFAVISWLGLHLHYIAAFVVLFSSFWVLLMLFRQGKRREMGRFFWLQGCTAVLALPWFLLVLRNWPTVSAEANAGTYLADPAPPLFVLRQIWLFHLTGLAGVLAQSAAWPAGLLLASFSLPLIPFLEKKKAFFTLSLLWMVPLGAALYVWSVRSFSHPRYISMFAILLLLPLALLWAEPAQQRRAVWRCGQAGLQLGGVGAYLFLAGLGLSLYFFDSGTAKDDIRGVAAYLEAEVTAVDRILIPETDYSLQFEYDGAAPMIMPALNEPEQLWPLLAANSGPEMRIFQLDYANGTRDWQEALPVILETAGDLQSETRIDELIVREYRMERPISRPSFAPGARSFSGLQLQAIAFPADESNQGAVPIALSWEVSGSDLPRLQTALQLVDATGLLRAESSRVLLDGEGRPSDLWSPGQRITTYHLLPLTPGTPPISHTLTLQLFSVVDGDVLPYAVVDERGNPQTQPQEVAEFELWLAKGDAGNPYGAAAGVSGLGTAVELAPNLFLQGAALDRREFVPGETVFAYLDWRAAGPVQNDPIALSLHQDSALLTGETVSPLAPYFPPILWPAGSHFVERRALTIPPEAAGNLTVRLEGSAGVYELGEISVAGTPRLFTSPEPGVPLSARFGALAELVGLDPPPAQHDPRAPLPVTLYWQALQTGSEIPYHVYVHVVDGDGRLLGQHDGPPANGAQPTTGWLGGEYIIDTHQVQFRIQDYAGPAEIWVGLYDPATGDRLPLPDGSDKLILPVAVELMP